MYEQQWWKVMMYIICEQIIKQSIIIRVWVHVVLVVHKRNLSNQLNGRSGANVNIYHYEY